MKLYTLILSLIMLSSQACAGVISQDEEQLDDHYRHHVRDAVIISKRHHGPFAPKGPGVNGKQTTIAGRHGPRGRVGGF